MVYPIKNGDFEGGKAIFLMMLMYDTICKVYPYHRDGGSYKSMII